MKKMEKKIENFAFFSIFIFSFWILGRKKKTKQKQTSQTQIDLKWWGNDRYDDYKIKPHGYEPLL